MSRQRNPKRTSYVSADDVVLSRFDTINAREEELVRKLGEDIGYGRTMQLCEKLWNDKLARAGMKRGGEHAVYCCAIFLVPCPGCAPARRRDESCGWCCGAGRVTKRVAKAIRLAERKPRAHRTRRASR